MKKWLIKWDNGYHHGDAIVTAQNARMAAVYFVSNTSAAIEEGIISTKDILSIEELPESDVETLIGEVWI